MKFYSIISCILLVALVSCQQKVDTQNPDLHSYGTYDSFQDDLSDYLETELSKKPEDDFLHFQMAQIKLERREWGLAEDHIQKAISLNNKKGDYAYIYALILSHKEDFQEALNQAEQALSLGVNHALLHREIAYLNARLGNKVEAREAVGKARLKDDQTTFIMALLWLMDEDTLVAKQRFEKIDYSNPNNGDALKYYSRILVDQGDLVKAAQLIDLGLKDNPSSLELLFQSANLAYSQDSIAKSLRMLNNLFSYEPGHEEGRILAARVALQERNYDEVFSNLQVRSEWKDKKEVWMLMGEAHKKQRNYYKALEYYKKVLEIAPADTEAQEQERYLLGVIKYLNRVQQASSTEDI